jgi:hypothetical protein
MMRKRIAIRSVEFVQNAACNRLRNVRQRRGLLVEDLSGVSL